MAASEAQRNIRRGIEAFNRDDHEGLLAFVTDDVEWQRIDGLPESDGLVRGRDALREHLKPDVFATGRLELLELVEGDGVILLHGVFHATGAASGIEIHTDTYAVYRFNEDGLAWRIENWRGREDAERSSGLRLG
jgi:ketosteroid isomerase-like protein